MSCMYIIWSKTLTKSRSTADVSLPVLPMPVSIVSFQSFLAIYLKPINTQLSFCPLLRLANSKCQRVFQREDAIKLGYLAVILPIYWIS